MQEREDLTNVALAICNTHRMKFISKVGEGGFKQTFHVENDSGTPFALKVYNPCTRDERINREITSMTRCSHPSIAKIHGIDNFTDNEKQYLFAIEEFLAGGTLQVCY